MITLINVPVFILELSPVHSVVLLCFRFVGMGHSFWLLQTAPLSVLYAKGQPACFLSGFKFSKLLGLNAIFGTHGNICVFRINVCHKN